jgi:4-hydroxybenzoate polyprenyltransferase
MTLLAAYARERLIAGPVLAAVLLVAGAALSGRGWSGAADVLTDIIAASGLVIAFRIWDDVADRERDRLVHPHRVLVRASSTAVLQGTAWTIAAGVALLLGRTRGPAPVVLVAAYGVVLAVAYAMRAERTAARDRILLLKYGVFTLALIGLPGAWTGRGLLSAAAAFAAACAYEWWHDAQSPVFSFGGSR